MSHREAQVAKERLLEVGVTLMEAAVVIDMAQAVKAGSTVFSWGHDRLALAILKRPGSIAAKRALTGRIIPALISKGIITKRSGAHRGRHAEYDLIVLHDDWAAEMGTTLAGTHSGTGMGTGSDKEWVPVSEGMGTAQTGTPATVSPTHTPKSSAHASPDALASATQKDDHSSTSMPEGTARKKRWTALPDGFAPNDEHRDKAREKGVSLIDEFASFRDYHLANGSRKADWDAELRLWLGRSRPGPARPGRGKAAGELMNEVLAIKLPGEHGYSGESVA